MSEYSIFTSESVSEGHPDKVADQISDAVLDAIIARDPYARVAVETLVKTGMAVVAGEVTTSCYVDLGEMSGLAALKEKMEAEEQAEAAQKAKNEE